MRYIARESCASLMSPGSRTNAPVHVLLVVDEPAYMGVVVLAALAGGDTKDYRITRAPPPTIAVYRQSASSDHYASFARMGVCKSPRVPRFLSMNLVRLLGAGATAMASASTSASTFPGRTRAPEGSFRPSKERIQ